MTKYEHLLSEHWPVADLPDADRIQWIRAERWINHPNAEMALAGMSDLLTYPKSPSGSLFQRASRRSMITLEAA